MCLMRRHYCAPLWRIHRYKYIEDSYSFSPRTLNKTSFALYKPNPTQSLHPHKVQTMAKGSCMCGDIAYEYSGEPAVTALCHCTDCQKWSGSAYTSNVVVPRKDFKVTKGSPKNYNIKGDSGKMNDHWFCGSVSPFSLPLYRTQASS